MENRRLRLTAALALAASLGAAGCGRAKARDCNALNERINAGVARVDALEKERLARPEGGPVQTAQAMEKTGKLYRELAEGITAVDLSERELKNLATDYAASLKFASGAAEALARATASNRRDEATTADEVYAKEITRQKTIVEKINAFCAR